jgi:hypothetical protein
MISRHAIALIVGYAVSIVLGDLVTASVANAKRGQGLALARPLGVVERTAYTTALLYSQPAFIGVWLAMKTLGVAPWSADRKGYHHRLLYQRSLILSGVSLAWGVLGWRVIHWIDYHHPTKAGAVIVALTLACAVLACWLSTLDYGFRDSVWICARRARASAGKRKRWVVRWVVRTWRKVRPEPSATQPPTT